MLKCTQCHQRPIVHQFSLNCQFQTIYSIPCCCATSCCVFLLGIFVPFFFYRVDPFSCLNCIAYFDCLPCYYILTSWCVCHLSVYAFLIHFYYDVTILLTTDVAATAIAQQQCTKAIENQITLLNKKHNINICMCIDIQTSANGCTEHSDGLGW